jgi:hypothetical protein
MLNINRKIIEWSDKKMAEAIEEGNGAKAFMAGAVEGFASGAILMYVPLLIGCYVWKHEALKK